MCSRLQNVVPCSHRDAPAHVICCIVSGFRLLYEKSLFVDWAALLYYSPSLYVGTYSQTKLFVFQAKHDLHVRIV